jgi:hypothetical protein
MFRQAFSGNNDEADVAETVRHCAESPDAAPEALHCGVQVHHLIIQV